MKRINTKKKALLIGVITCCLVTLMAQAAPRLFLRTASDGEVTVQIQGWTQEVAPTVTAAPLLEKGELFEMTDFQPLDADGVWEKKGRFEGQDPGFYRLTLPNDNILEEKRTSAFLKEPGVFEVVRGQIRHAESAVVWQSARPTIARVSLQFPSGLLLAKANRWLLYPAGEQRFEMDLTADNTLIKNHPSLSAAVQMAEFHDDVLLVPGSGEDLITLADLPEFEFPNQNLPFQVQAFSAEGEPTETLTAGGRFRLTLAPETFQFLNGRRYEILLYLDGDFIHEESQGVSPYTYQLPTTLPDSSSTLTINLLDYEGNWGVQSLRYSVSSSKTNP